MSELSPQQAREVLRSAGVDVPDEIRVAPPRPSVDPPAGVLRSLPRPVLAVLRFPGLDPIRLRTDKGEA